MKSSLLPQLGPVLVEGPQGQAGIKNCSFIFSFFSLYLPHLIALFLHVSEGDGREGIFRKSLGLIMGFSGLSGCLKLIFFSRRGAFMGLFEIHPIGHT